MDFTTIHPLTDNYHNNKHQIKIYYTFRTHKPNKNQLNAMYLIIKKSNKNKFYLSKKIIKKALIFIVYLMLFTT